jgi:superfamily II DNA/RNA helicase
VVNMSVGLSIFDYVHRCGRTGRKHGELGVAHTFVVKGDEHLCPALVDVLQASRQKVPPDLKELADRQSGKITRVGKATERQSAAQSSGKNEEEEERRQKSVENREKQRLEQQKKKAKETSQQKKKPNSGFGGKRGGVARR